MLAIREERKLEFFEYLSKDDVREYLRSEYETIVSYEDEGVLSVPRVAKGMSELILHELYLRQLNVGDVDMFPSRDECIAAYDDDAKMEAIMSDASEIFERSEMFSRHHTNTTHFEQMLIDDVILLLEEFQLMYARPIASEHDGVFLDSDEFVCSVENCVLQEVW